MPRPRAFDDRIVLARAMDTFWSRGFEATSVDDLCVSMGLSRSSLYQAFGSKADLLYAVLDHYADQSAENVRRRFPPSEPVVPALTRFLSDFIDDALEGSGRRGCLLGNCAAELAESDAEASRRVTAGLVRIQNVFEQVLDRAKRNQEIRTSASPRALARFLTASVQGLRLMAKANPDREALDDIARQIRAGLGC